MRSLETGSAALALFAVIFLGGQVRAQTAEGQVRLGYQGASDDFGSAKFDQYRDEGPGLLLDGYFLLEGEENGRYFRGWLDQLTNDNQQYRFMLGRYGRYELDFGMSQFWQVESNNGLTPYSSGRNQVLPPGWMATNDPATQLAQLRAGAFGRDLRFRQRNYTSGFRLWPSEDLLLRAHHELRDRDGTRRGSLQFGSAGGRFMNFAQPVDDHTHVWEGVAALVRPGWNLEFAYDGSAYDNDANNATTVQNATDQGNTTVGRVVGEPDNRAHQFSLSGSAPLAGESNTRVGRLDRHRSVVGFRVILWREHDHATN